MDSIFLLDVSFIIQIHQDKPCSIPYLIYKMPVPKDPFFRELDIPPLCSEGCQGKTKGICSELIHYLERINNVALRFAHFFAFCISHKGMYIHLFKWDVSHEMEPHHHHPGYPKKEDIKASHKDRGRIKSIEFIGLVRPT